MLPSYTFNEELKRFEPIEKKCNYCIEKSEETTASTAYYIPLFKEADRTNIVVYRSVKYKKISIGIPRCHDCLTIHNLMKGKSKMYAWGGAIIIFVLAIIFFGPVGIVIGIFLSLLTGFLGSHLLENNLVEDRGILTPLDGAKENAVVQEFIIGGWSFTQPTA